jgi:hypothetical protein
MAAVLLLGGCAPYAVNTTADATLVTVTSRPDVMPQALISGRLAIVNGGCFGIIKEEGNEFAAIFPVGTTAEGDALTIPGLGEVKVGDDLEGGGGFGEKASLDPSLPEECRTDEVAYLNPFD